MKFRVLVTRDPERARELADLLALRGIETVVEPVTQTVYTWQNQPLPDLTAFNWIAFTSVHAVIGFAQALQAAGVELPQDLSLAVVGPATAAEAERRLRRPNLIAEAASSSAQGLAQALAKVKPEAGRVSLLWPCSALVGEDFSQALNEMGFAVTPWECYTTQAISPDILTARLIARQPWQAAVFAAPSAVQAFAAAWPLPWNFACVAIGGTTAGALRKVGVIPAVVSPTPDAGSVAEAVLQALDI